MEKRRVDRDHGLKGRGGFFSLVFFGVGVFFSVLGLCGTEGEWTFGKISDIEFGGSKKGKEIGVYLLFLMRGLRVWGLFLC